MVVSNYGIPPLTLDNYISVKGASTHSGLTNVTAITAGTYHTCALTDMGAVKCWGLNSSGQLGNGTTTLHNLPTNVNGLASGVTAIAAGPLSLHTCAITDTGVKCWGNNNSGQLGDGSTIQRNSPADVVDLPGGVTSLALGGGHTCALAGGGIKCWGNNNKGQLGDGTTVQHITPTDVIGVSGAVALTLGNTHSCAIATGGAAKCWGENTNAQLGDGTTVQHNAPTDVNGLATGVLAISAGNFHTCVVASVARGKCWGDNIAGQLGDGTTTNHAVPADIVWTAPSPTPTPTQIGGAAPYTGFFMISYEQAAAAVPTRTRTRTSTRVPSTATLTPTHTITPTATLTPNLGSTPTLAAFTGATYVYDGDGKMVKTTVNSVMTYYASRSYQITNGIVTKYYGSYAMRDNGELFYLLSDHLGSTSITLNTSGGLVSELRYKAFGEIRHANGKTSTDYRYTGQRQQADIGLYFYNARWYDPVLGRFTQADTIVPGAGNPQAHDRYAYTANNPIRYNDPTGHTYNPPCWFCDIKWFDYSSITGTTNAILDGVAQVGCWFGGCHVDTTTDVIVGPTKAERIQALGGDLMGLASPLAVVPTGKIISGAASVSDDLIYAGVRQASQLMQDMGIPRDIRKKTLETFDVRTIQVMTASFEEYGIRYYDNVNAFPAGRFLTETFPASRESLAIKHEWNDMTYLKQWQLRPKITFLQGITSPQGPYLPGGLMQKYVFNPKTDLLEIR